MFNAEAKGSQVPTTLNGILISTIGKYGVLRMGQSGIFKAPIKKH